MSLLPGSVYRDRDVPSISYRDKDVPPTGEDTVGRRDLPVSMR